MHKLQCETSLNYYHTNSEKIPLNIPLFIGIKKPLQESESVALLGRGMTKPKKRPLPKLKRKLTK
jgi:hypothetical protein